jgi:menaquinone-dependent protoporphyrinogen oxidase
MKILVAYASKHGSTAEIAATIGDELRVLGNDVDVVDARALPHPDAYDATVLGSAVYIGRWRPEAIRFLQKFAEPLRGQPLWFFESGPTDASAEAGPVTPSKRAAAWGRDLGVRGHVVFGGRFTRAMVGRWTARLVESGGREVYGDYRNFERMRAWARSIDLSLHADVRSSPSSAPAAHAPGAAAPPPELPVRTRSLRVAGYLAILFGIAGAVAGGMGAATFVPFRDASTFDGRWAGALTAIAFVGAMLSLVGIIAGRELLHAHRRAWKAALAVAAGCVASVAAMTVVWPASWGFLAVVSAAYGLEIALLLVASSASLRRHRLRGFPVA